MTTTTAQASARATGRKTWKDLPVIPRRIAVLIALIVIWQLYVTVSGVTKLAVATPLQVAQAFIAGWASGKLALATLTTMELLLLGLVIGVAIATVLTTLAIWTRIGEDVLVLLSSMLNPLPSVAVLPLAILWFGLGRTALVFVMANAVVWPVAINVSMGFRTVNPTIMAVSRNIGLQGVRIVSDVMIPAALPHIVSGLKTAWAYGWRTIVAAELVFGVAGGKGGLGWFINDARYFLRTPDVFAGLLTIMLIGIVFDVAFNVLERKTVVRWGMKAR